MEVVMGEVETAVLMAVGMAAAVVVAAMDRVGVGSVAAAVLAAGWVVG